MRPIYVDENKRFNMKIFIENFFTKEITRPNMNTNRNYSRSVVFIGYSNVKLRQLSALTLMDTEKNFHTLRPRTSRERIFKNGYVAETEISFFFLEYQLFRRYKRRCRFLGYPLNLTAA